MDESARKANDTVIFETPATFAISVSVTRFLMDNAPELYR